jgi:flagellar biosynthesis GTPase FlhF
MQLQQIPRAIVCTGLGTARLPFAAVETLVRRREDGGGRWPLALAFDSFEASVKQVAGSLLHDDTLLEEGRLAEARVFELRKAAQLEAVAQQRKEQADANYKTRREADERQRREAKQRVAERESALERERQEKKRRAEQDAQKRNRLAEQLEQAEEKAVEHQDRAARAAAIAAERDALRQERAAVAGKNRVAELDDAIAETKSARKSS